MLRVTYVNALLAPLALAKFRVCEPFLRSPPSSRIDSEPWWLDRLLYMPLALESYWLGAGLNFPVGQTLLLIGRKSGLSWSLRRCLAVHLRPGGKIRNQPVVAGLRW